MENYQYNNLIINHKLTKLANITNINDLVEYKYLNLYLIEYLLRDGIHTTIMDSHVKHSSKWILFYLKYNILKPLIKCHIEPLLETISGEILLEKLLRKLNDDEKIQLFDNLKENSYWELRKHEKEIVSLYAKYNIKLSPLFINMPSIFDISVTERKSDQALINEFKNAFKDTNSHVLDIYIHELKKRLSINHKRAQNDIKKLIDYKKKHRTFKLLISSDTEGEYDSKNDSITISGQRHNILTHELSHFLYNTFEDEDYIDDLRKYESIRTSIINEKTINKIIEYLKKFHLHFNEMYDYFEKIYYFQINKKYGSYNNYVKAICNDILKKHPDMISANDNVYFYIDNENILDVVTELLIIEKNEFVNISTRNYYTEELMLENLLDALLKGGILDGKYDIECLSGHMGLSFLDDEELSFDECLADYDTIKNSKKGYRLINDLESIVGDELIKFLDSYLKRKRGIKHGL